MHGIHCPVWFTSLFSLRSGCVDFAADLARQRRKSSGGGFEVSENDFGLHFFSWCVFFFVLIYSFHAVQRLWSCGAGLWCSQTITLPLGLCGGTYTTDRQRPHTGWEGLGQVSIGKLRMPMQPFSSPVKRSTPADMVGGCFLKSDSPSFALSAADRALRSRSSGPGKAAPWCY